MPDRILSIFGTYDFFGKSFPGMALIVGLVPLLPTDSVPVPELFSNIFIFIAFLTAVILLGTLGGEAVHSIAILFENVVAWIARRFRNTANLIIEESSSDNNRFSIESPNQPSISQFRDESDDSLELSHRIWANWKYNIYKWFEERYLDIVYILWNHRGIFESRMSSNIQVPDPSPDFSSTNLAFTDEHLIETAVEDFDIHTRKDIANIYPVVMSLLSEEDCQRAFRFQSRYSFCRSMWVIMFFTSILYWLLFAFPTNFVPSALQYTTYLHSLTNAEIGFISLILLFISMVFAFASGSYKRIFIEYIMSEFYIINTT